MSAQKFFYLTIQGDNLNVEEAQEKINLPCKIFRKGETLPSKYSKPHSPQKTNRWLYSMEDNSKISSEEFLTEQLKILIIHIEEIKDYIARGMAELELTLYADNDTYFCLTKDHILLLQQLKLELFLSFC